MELLRHYLDKPLNHQRAQDEPVLIQLGFGIRYVPDPPEEFDEYEFSTVFKGAEVGIAITIVNSLIKKVMFGLVDADDSDILRAFDSQQLTAFVAEREHDIIAFFDHLTL